MLNAGSQATQYLPLVAAGLLDRGAGRVIFDEVARAGIVVDVRFKRHGPLKLRGSCLARKFDSGVWLDANLVSTREPGRDGSRTYRGGSPDDIGYQIITARRRGPRSASQKLDAQY